jgi:hypothetical protein
MRKRRAVQLAEADRVADDFCEWVSSLPYVRRRSHGLSQTVSMFDVDCEPLERRLTWLVVDHEPTTAQPTRICARLPRAVAKAAEKARFGVHTVPMLPNHVLFTIDPLAHRRDVESLVLAAYGDAMS